MPRLSNPQLRISNELCVPQNLIICPIDKLCGSSLLTEPPGGGLLVQSVKRSLRKCIRISSLYLDELNTLMIEVESVMNSRPLTYVYDDTVHFAPLICCTGKEFLPLSMIYTQRLSVLMRLTKEYSVIPCSPQNDKKLTETDQHLKIAQVQDEQPL